MREQQKRVVLSMGNMIRIIKISFKCFKLPEVMSKKCIKPKEKSELGSLDVTCYHVSNIQCK